MFTLPLKCLSHTLIFGTFIFNRSNAWLVAGKVADTFPVPDLLTGEEEEVLHSQGGICRRVAAFGSAASVPRLLSVTMVPKMSASVWGLVLNHRYVICRLWKRLQPASFAELHF